MITQTRLSSFIEALLNNVLGFIIALASQYAIFPFFGIHLSLADNLWINVWFTVISLLRGYAVRRWFNARLHKAALRMSGLPD